MDLPFLAAKFRIKPKLFPLYMLAAKVIREHMPLNKIVEFNVSSDIYALISTDLQYNSDNELEKYHIIGEKMMWTEIKEEEQQIVIINYNALEQLEKYTIHCDTDLLENGPNIISEGTFRIYNQSMQNILTYGYRDAIMDEDIDDTIHIIRNLHGTQLSYYDNGKIRSSIHYENDVRHGTCIIYQDNGSIASSAHYKYNNLDGLKTIYWHNGRLKSICTFKNGILDGILKKWSEDRTLIREMNLKYGKIHGRVREWYDDGSLHREENFVDGLRHGKVQIWNENKELDIDTEWQKGKLIHINKPMPYDQIISQLF